MIQFFFLIWQFLSVTLWSMRPQWNDQWMMATVSITYPEFATANVKLCCRTQGHRKALIASPQAQKVGLGVVCNIFVCSRLQVSLHTFYRMRSQRFRLPELKIILFWEVILIYFITPHPQEISKIHHTTISYKYLDVSRMMYFGYFCCEEPIVTRTRQCLSILTVSSIVNWLPTDL